jgi:hypothetical protein
MKGWTTFAACVLLGVGLASPARATVDPTPPSTAQLETRANTAFSRGDYNNALPILKKLTETYKDEPTRLLPLQEKIRVCEKALASLKTAAAPPVIVPGANEAASAELRKVHVTPRAGETVELTIKELGNFEYDQAHGGNIPADVAHLGGAKIRVRGFMIPMDQAENITQFALVPSLFSCCLGQPPQIQHTIVCDCPKGKAVGYCPDEITVEGILKVEEKKDDGYIVSIFNLGVTSVKPAPR